MGSFHSQQPHNSGRAQGTFTIMMVGLDCKISIAIITDGIDTVAQH